MPPDVLHTTHRVLAEQRAERLRTVAVLRHIRRCSLRLHDRLCHGERHDAVIRCKTALAKEIKLLAAVIVELEPRANDIANDCSDHIRPPKIILLHPLYHNIRINMTAFMRDDMRRDSIKGESPSAAIPSMHNKGAAAEGFSFAQQPPCCVLSSNTCSA